jgi:hypothetical protein
MLKTSKILIIGLGATTVGLGSYVVYTKFFNQQNQIVKVKNNSTKDFDTIPEKDSSLDALNKILSDNNDSKSLLVAKNNVVVETYENIDKNSALYDSLVAAGSVVDINVKKETNVNDSKTIIKADKFIAKETFIIIGFTKNNNDSLMNSLIDVKTGGNGKLTIEFWESPVNFKGYRLGKDKMIVFGIVPDDVKLIKHKTDLYLVTINNVYLIKPCNDFCALKPIKDKSVCADVMSHVN